jgi:hypothetical protein
MVVSTLHALAADHRSTPGVRAAASAQLLAMLAPATAGYAPPGQL